MMGLPEPAAVVAISAARQTPGAALALQTPQAVGTQEAVALSLLPTQTHLLRQHRLVVD
jgi:hypothetical protein